ncbi:MAG: YkgJ family cysteine cluster protein [Myxococcales bacterium]|nr:YkgJ family cysteine cluster protein [Myxococcales bacterium]
MRARLCPQVERAVRITITDPDPDLGIQLTYRLMRDGERGAAKLPAQVAALLLYFDGEKSCDEIQDEIEAQGIDLPQADFVQVLAESLERVGIVKMNGRPVTVSGIHRYRCVACGNSCRGDEVGPLAQSEVDLLNEQWQQIRAEVPAIAHLEPLRRDDEGRWYLARPNDGKCAFLDDENLCRVHARFGFDKKPLACRLFPLVAITAGESIRLGYSAACSRLHQTFDSAPAVDIEDEWRGFTSEVTPLKRRYNRDARVVSTSVQEDRDLVEADSEEYLCEWLGSHTLSIGGLAHMATFLVEPPSETLSVPVAVANQLAVFSRRFASAIDDDAEWLATLAPSERDLLEAAAVTLAQAELAPEILDSLGDRTRRYLAYRTANFLWLREGFSFGTLPLALSFVASAAAAAAWFATLSDFRASSNEEVRFDRFGQFAALSAKFAQRIGGHLLPADQRTDVPKRWESYF